MNPTRAKSVKSAFVLLCHKMGEKVTVDEICAATNWSEETIKTYYRKKWRQWGVLYEVERNVYKVRIPATLTEDVFLELHSQVDKPIDFLWH